MAKQFQFRRGTTAAHSSFTGAIGEITVDTTKDTVVVHDGSTAGGFPLQTEAYFNVKDFGAVGDGTTDDTAAFQAAIDLAATAGAGPLSLLHRGGMVVVPRTEAGYVINGLNMRSHVWLLGMGMGVLLKMTATDATNCINGLGSLDTEDGQHSWSRIENLIIQGSKDVGGTGNGIYYEEHDNNFLYNLRIRRCGKHGFHGEIASGGAKSDGLEIRSCYIENCVGNGIHITDGKYTTIGGECRIVNNNSGNIFMTGISCRIIGGAINCIEGFYGIHLANSRVITLNNVLLEGIERSLPAGLSAPSSENIFLKLGDTPSIDTVQAIQVENLQFLTTGGGAANTDDTVFIDLINTRDVTIDSCRFDADIDSPGSIIGVRTASGSAQRTIVKSSNFPSGGINAGTGTSAKYEFNDKRALATEGTKKVFFPAFRADDPSSTSPLNVGVNKVLNFTSLVFDRIDGWNPTTAPAFIVPEDGLYHFETTVIMNGVLNAADSFDIKIVAGSKTFHHVFDFGEFVVSPTTWTISFTCLAEMTKNQGAQVQWTQTGGANGNITSFGAESYFSGYQVA